MKTLYKNPNLIAYLMCALCLFSVGVSIYSLITHNYPKLGVLNGGLLLSPIIIMISYKNSLFKSIVKFYTIFSIPYLYLSFTGNVIDKLASLIFALTICITYIVINYLNNKRTESADDSNIRQV